MSESDDVDGRDAPAPRPAEAGGGATVTDLSDFGAGDVGDEPSTSSASTTSDRDRPARVAVDTDTGHARTGHAQCADCGARDGTVEAWGARGVSDVPDDVELCRPCALGRGQA